MTTQATGRGRTPAAKKTAKKTVKKASDAAPGELRVRMYRVGFGDFFLVTIPSDDGSQHILIDCGVVSGTTGKGDIRSLESAVAHMVEETGKKLALVVMTHRHADHIIGFSRCADQFEGFTAEAVWMPRWESEYDADAKDAQDEVSGLAQRLHVALAAASDPDAVEARGMLLNALGPEAMGLRGGGTNAASLQFLKTKLGVSPSYLACGDEAPLPKSLVDAGLSARILGPPPLDQLQFLKLMDLTKGVGQYLDADPAVGAGPLVPFGDEWKAGPGAYPVSAFREWAERDREGRPGAAVVDAARSYHPEMEKRLSRNAPSALAAAALAIDKVLNNQSLVILFEFGGKSLLFAGDAQAGNWEYWLYPGDDPTKKPGQVAGESAAILKDLAFYKVGHHGSTNATPIAAVDAMAQGLVAMCSTQEDTYGSPDKGTEVPRKPLMEALAGKASLVRSDQIPAHAGDEEVPPDEDAGELPTVTRGRIVPGDGYVDYFL
jgi:beta-lactamase superfamily II metal-dependent hydrolase